MQSSNTSDQKPQSTPPATVTSVGPQQWMMGLQYQNGGMMVPPQHYALPPHYMPYHPHGYARPAFYVNQNQENKKKKQERREVAAAAADMAAESGGENRTIWIGDLQHWMDENYLHRCFVNTGEIASIKVIRNRYTGAPEGYGFVEFHTHEMAEKVLQGYSGATMLHTVDQPFRLNWATFSTGDKRSSDNGSDLSIFVGDLAPDVTDGLLHETFASKYPSVKAVKVVIDVNSGRSKGYGFVRFGDENERAQAMNEMNGVYCSSRAMRIAAATPRKYAGHQQGGYASNGASSHGAQAEADSMNTTIFIGGLDPNVTDEELRQSFSQYGDIVSVKIPSGKGCGFVQFADRSNAEEALQKLNGKVIGVQTVRLSWGRNPANRQMRGDFGSPWNGAYYGGHIYDGYDYGVPHPHISSMYAAAAAAAAAYGPFSVYGNQQVN